MTPIGNSTLEHLFESGRPFRKHLFVDRPSRLVFSEGQDQRGMRMAHAAGFVEGHCREVFCHLVCGTFSRSGEQQRRLVLQPARQRAAQ